MLDVNAAVNATGQTQPYVLYVWPHRAAFTATEKPALGGISQHRRLMLVWAPHATCLNLSCVGPAPLAAVAAPPGVVAPTSPAPGP